MLSLRLALVTAGAALCLWGLFSLLDNLKEPGLLRSEKAAVVKGCDTLDDADKLDLCPPLFCQKALLDAKAVSRRANFRVTVDRQGEDPSQRLIGGTAGDRPNATVIFACVVESGRVSDARVVSADDLDALAQKPGDWVISED